MVIKNETYSLTDMLCVARGLEPVRGSEYARGICELIGRLRLDVAGHGGETAANAAEVEDWICEPKKEVSHE